MFERTQKESHSKIHILENTKDTILYDPYLSTHSFFSDFYKKCARIGFVSVSELFAFNGSDTLHIIYCLLNAFNNCALQLHNQIIGY